MKISNDFKMFNCGRSFYELIKVHEPNKENERRGGFRTLSTSSM